MDALLSEKCRTEKGFLGDANGGAETVRIDLSKCHKLQFEVQLNAGVATTLGLQLREHDAATAGNSANLASSLPHYRKADADAAYVRVDGDVASADLSSLDTAAGTVLVEVYKEDLSDNFRYVSLQVSDPGAARIVSVSAHLDSKQKPAYLVEL